MYAVNGVASLLGDEMLVKRFAHVWESLGQCVLHFAELDLSSSEPLEPTRLRAYGYINAESLTHKAEPSRSSKQALTPIIGC